jgi:IS1 family transposase
LPELSETLLQSDTNDASATILELDELWSFIVKKANKMWIWIAHCWKTRQVVARVIGDRSKETCLVLWNNVPEAYKAGHCFSDFWEAYQAIIPDEQLDQVGKEMGETVHIECWNCTPRQRLCRFIRKTLSFSKDIIMHTLCLDLFFYRYNLERAISLI